MTSAEGLQYLMKLDKQGVRSQAQEAAQRELESVEELSQKRFLTPQSLVVLLKKILQDTKATSLQVLPWKKGYTQVERTLIFGKAAGRYEVCVAKNKIGMPYVLYKHAPDVIR